MRHMNSASATGTAKWINTAIEKKIESMESPMMPVNIVFQVQHRHTLHQPDTSPKRTNKKRSCSKHERFVLYFPPNWTSELSMIFQRSQKMSKAKKSTRRLGHNMPQQLKKQEKQIQDLP